MLEELIRKKDKNPTLDKVSDKIDETIDYHIGDDVFLKILPILSSKDLLITSDFFDINKITPNSAKSFSSDELKTISYMAKFYKEKVKYSVGEIERYLTFLGYDLEERATDIVCVRKDGEYKADLDTNIEYQTYLNLATQDYLQYKHTIKQIINNQKPKHIIRAVAESSPFLDGFDYGFDIVRMR